MSRRLPPFTAVRAFEATARHLSMTDAAEELHLTPSAISHQVRLLEEFLDTALFRRMGNRLTLTLTGRNYAGRLTSLLDDFDGSTAEAQGRRGDLRVLCTPGFAARWLVPRLDRFADAATIRLRVAEGAPDTDFTRNDADVVIQWTSGEVPDAVVEPLMESIRYPIISPALLARARPQNPGDLLRLTLIYDEVDDAWAEWFARAGISVPELPQGPRYPNCEFATTAVECDQGVSLAYDAVVRGTIAAGRVVRLFSTVTLPMVIYSVTYLAKRSDEPPIRGFRDFLMREVARDGVRPTSLRIAG